MDAAFRWAFGGVLALSMVAGLMTGRSLSSRPAEPARVTDDVVRVMPDPVGPSFDDAGTIRACYYGKHHLSCPCAR